MGPFRHLFGLEVNEAQMMTTVGADLFEITTGFYPSGGAPNSPFTVTFWAYYGWYSLIGVAILALGSSSLCYHVQNQCLIPCLILVLRLSCSDVERVHLLIYTCFQ